MKRSAFIAYAAAIAALYTVLTMTFMPIGFEAVQLRISEALTILPIFTPAAIPGLFVGCLISNILGGFGAPDIILGSLATLTAAFFTYKLRANKWLAMLPPVLINAIIVGGYLEYFYSMGWAAQKFFEGVCSVALPHMPMLFSMISVGVGQLGACYLLGMPLIVIVSKHKNTIFRK